MPGPLSRIRLYGAPRQYQTVLNELLTGKTSAGDDVSRLEVAIAKRQNCRHAVAMPRARTALYFALKNLIQPGQDVILSPYTVSEVVNAVVCAGGVPVFADIDRATCNIGPAEIARLIDHNTGAVIVTHFYGLLAEVEEISALCAATRVPMLEDAAQAFEGRRGGHAAGTFGIAGAYSFGLHKNINSFLGGMLVTNDDSLAERIRADIKQLPPEGKRSLLGQVAYGLFTDAITWPPAFRSLTFPLLRWAFLNDIERINNLMRFDLTPQLRTRMPDLFLCRMLPLQARLILKQLERVEDDTLVRIRTARMYHDGLKDCPGLILPPLREDFSHTYWYFPIQFADRRALVKFAMRHGRDITMSYHRNCAAMPCFAKWQRSCPNAQATADSLIYLPTYPSYSPNEIHRNIDVIGKFFGV